MFAAVNRSPEDPRDPVRPRQMWRRVPVDVVALLLIALAIIATQQSIVRRGMCFNDPSWYFHFGHRTALGAVPYRDFVFQVGPLPIYVDALFQKVFGGTYVASLYAAMLIKILRVFVIWAIARRTAGIPTAIALSVFCALDPLFSFSHHWSTSYAHLFISLSGLCFLQASRLGPQSERGAELYLALAGLCACLVVTARQSSAVILGVVLLAATSIMTVRKIYFTRRRLAALWVGFATGIVLVFGSLAIVGALGPAIQQMFLDAPEKKGVHGIRAVLDAISGGALVVGGDFTWWGGFLIFLGLPVAFVSALFVLASRDQPLSLGSAGMAALPVAIAVGLMIRFAQFELFSDVPRTFLSGLLGLAVVFPDRLRSWFGLEPAVALGLGALPLASDWALEMSYPGRGWGDAPALVVGVILVMLASRHITTRGKAVFCAVLAVIAVSGTMVLLHNQINPFAKDAAADGRLVDNEQRSHNRRLRGMKVNEARKRGLEWLMKNVPGHSTCFVYGNLPVLYTLLNCQNATRIDTTAADFITEQDALDALAVLRGHPPDYLIAHESTWMSPSLTLDLGGDVARYDSLNQRASRALHVGLRGMLDQYESLGTIVEQLPSELKPLTENTWDLFGTIHLYRRRVH